MLAHMLTFSHIHKYKYEEKNNDAYNLLLTYRKLCYK
jgi:hypothetical protein